MDTVAVRKVLSEYLSAHPDGLVAAYLFGSAARGTAGPRSDIDVAVLYSATPPATIEGLPLDLEGRLERLLGRPVQVVDLLSFATTIGARLPGAR